MTKQRVIRPLIWFLCSSVLMAFSAASFGQRTVSFEADRFGYELRQSAQCANQWIDISGSGSELSLSASGSDPAGDDGGVQLSLPEGLEFYGRWYQSLVISSNGYIAFAENLAAENGGDFSNDCSLPAVPDNGASSFARVAAFHDDLEAGDAGQIFFQHFTSCPRVGPLAGESCTVLQWHRWALHGAPSDELSFEILLYPASREVVVQYQNVDAMPSISASMGLQSANLRSALNVACNQSNALPPQGAWCAAFPAPVETVYNNSFESP